MDKTAFIFHGLSGNDQENWFPWLKGELQKQGWTVVIPNFPNPSNPNWELWRKHFEPYESQVNEKSIFIGHSLGVAFSLRVIEIFKIQAAYLVAGFIGPIDHQFNERVAPIANISLNWDKIRANCPQISVFHSDNDPYLPLQHAEALTKHLNANLHVISNGGHLNGSSGYLEFPELFDTILSHHK